MNHIHLAAEEDIASRLVEWARLFKATTWEELKVIATNNEAMASTANTAVLYESEVELAEKDRYIAGLEARLREKQ